jgi:two-component system, LytTR family, response regulator
MIRSVLIDDEPSAINLLSLILSKFCKEEVEVVASATDPFEGKELIQVHKPDVVFLDVEMPGLSGIDMVRSFSSPSFRVVFITAFDDYAVQAFRVNAIDYLLKPVDADDVINVVQKLKRELAQKQNPVEQQIKQLEKLFNGNTRLAIAMADKIIFVDTCEISYCEANGPYTYIHTIDGRKITASKPLGDFESQLPRIKFYRIHHSYLVNLSEIKEYQRVDGGYVIMKNNERLDVSQRKRKEFLEVIHGMVV